jgi:hypothetical protein
MKNALYLSMAIQPMKKSISDVGRKRPRQGTRRCPIREIASLSHGHDVQLKSDNIFCFVYREDWERKKKRTGRQKKRKV